MIRSPLALSRLAYAAVLATACIGTADAAPAPDSMPPDITNINIPDKAVCQQLTAPALTDLTLMQTLTHVLCKTPALNQALLLIDEQQAASDLA